jgi:hypothetical protein
MGLKISDIGIEHVVVKNVYKKTKFELKTQQSKCAYLAARGF